jgi:hypothetical protein
VTRDAAMAHLETYLVQVRRNLKGLSQSETQEVLLELRSHVLDRVEGQMTPATVEAALAALGNPRDVARANVTERVAAILETDRSFFGVLAAVVRLAGLSLAGFVLFLVSLIGYGMALSLLVVAVVKPFMPSRVGFWHQAGDAYSLGILGDASKAQGHELWGWWIIPIGLVAGLGLGWLTLQFGRVCVRWMARAGRRRRPNPMIARSAVSA